MSSAALYLSSEQGDDLRIESLSPLLSPALLRSEIPLSARSKSCISQARADVADVLAGVSDRLVVIVGPCSIHNKEEAREYAELLKGVMPDLPELVVIMRAYFEKVRLIHFLHLERATSSTSGSPQDRVLMVWITAAHENWLEGIHQRFVPPHLGFSELTARQTPTSTARSPSTRVCVLLARSSPTSPTWASPSDASCSTPSARSS